jgi:hypothetical protein
MTSFFYGFVLKVEIDIKPELPAVCTGFEYSLPANAPVAKEADARADAPAFTVKVVISLQVDGVHAPFFVHFIIGGDKRVIFCGVAWVDGVVTFV